MTYADVRVVRSRVVPSSWARPLAPTLRSVEQADMLCPACDVGCACVAEYCYTLASRDRNASQPVHCTSTRLH